MIKKIVEFANCKYLVTKKTKVAINECPMYMNNVFLPIFAKWLFDGIIRITDIDKMIAHINEIILSPNDISGFALM